MCSNTAVTCQHMKIIWSGLKLQEINKFKDPHCLFAWGFFFPKCLKCKDLLFLFMKYKVLNILTCLKRGCCLQLKRVGVLVLSKCVFMLWSQVSLRYWEIWEGRWGFDTVSVQFCWWWGWGVEATVAEWGRTGSQTQQWSLGTEADLIRQPGDQQVNDLFLFMWSQWPVLVWHGSVPGVLQQREIPEWKPVWGARVTQWPHSHCFWVAVISCMCRYKYSCLWWWKLVINTKVVPCWASGVSGKSSVWGLPVVFLWVLFVTTYKQYLTVLGSFGLAGEALSSLARNSAAAFSRNAWAHVFLHTKNNC